MMKIIDDVAIDFQWIDINDSFDVEIISVITSDEIVIIGLLIPGNEDYYSVSAICNT